MADQTSEGAMGNPESPEARLTNDRLISRLQAMAKLDNLADEHYETIDQAIEALHRADLTQPAEPEKQHVAKHNFVASLKEEYGDDHPMVHEAERLIPDEPKAECRYPACLSEEPGCVVGCSKRATLNRT